VNDYADRWAGREQIAARMSPEELSAYSMGLSNAYSDVFEAFGAAFEAGQDIHTLFARLSAQWDDVRATQIVRGVA
jgi:hypothetical protein